MGGALVLGPVALARPLLAAALLAALGAATLLLARRSRSELGPARLAIATAVRLALLAVLALAVAGLAWRREVPEVTTIFAVDSSDSARASLPLAARWVEAAAHAALPGDRVGVVQFGADALIEATPTEGLGTVALASRPRADGSDIPGALLPCRGLLPSAGRRRVVVMTDGDVDAEAASQAIRALAAEGVDVALAPMPSTRGPETLVESVRAPERVHEGEPFEVRVVLRASEATRGTLTVTRDGELLGQSDVDVPATAPIAMRLVDRQAATGTHRYRAHFDAKPDGWSQNDAAEAIVRVEGEPTVLLVAGKHEPLDAFVALLVSAGVRVERTDPFGLPQDPASAAEHDAIILANVDAIDLSSRQISTLRAFVREAGGGLLMTGGPSSFGPGGWYDTPVEEVLPVDMDVRNETYYPSLTLVEVIDKSGSMGGGGAASKLELAKEAARQSATLLHHGDRIGVVAFDSAAKWVVEVQDAGDRAGIQQRIGTIAVGGGTNIYPGLLVAAEAMEHEKTMLRHVILLSDGMSEPADYEGIVKRIRAAKATLSTVGVGSDADVYTMQTLAKLGGGRYYFTEDPQAIPRIFTKEAFSTARSFVVEERFTPRRAMPHVVLRGVGGLPDLAGYVATTAKPAADVALVTHREDPLLATMQQGLGRSAALTTDLGQRWAAAWMQSDAGRTLLAQLLRWTAGRADSPLLSARLERVEGMLKVEVEARTEDGAFLDFADLSARVVGPDLVERVVKVRQVAPGRYAGECEASEPGTYLAGVEQTAGGKTIRATTAVRAFSYSPEYASVAPPGDALARLASMSGARVLERPEDALVRSGPTASDLAPAWRTLVFLAALLLLLDVGVRRVMLPEGWAAVALARVRAALRFGGRDVVAAPAWRSRLAHAKGAARAAIEPSARVNVGAQMPATKSTPTPARVEPAQQPARAAAVVPVAERARPSAPATAASPPPSAPPLTAPPSAEPVRTGDDALASRLLAAKRRARR